MKSQHPPNHEPEHPCTAPVLFGFYVYLVLLAIACLAFAWLYG